MASKTNAQSKMEKAIVASYDTSITAMTKQSKTVMKAISAVVPTDYSPKGISAIERQIYDTYLKAFRAELETTVRASSTSLVEALVAAIGPSAILGIIGVTTVLSAAELAKTGVLTELVFAFLFGIGIAEFVASVISGILNRKAGDGKSTRDRIRIFANEVAKEIAKAIEASIKGDDTAATIAKRIQKVYKDAEWRVGRLVETETLTAYRTSVARLAGMSDVFSYVKIIDFPEGHRDTHPRHLCYKYARADEHGLGAGIYPATTVKIRNPHPQCRSILVPVLTEELGGA